MQQPQQQQQQQQQQQKGTWKAPKVFKSSQQFFFPGPCTFTGSFSGSVGAKVSTVSVGSFSTIFLETFPALPPTSPWFLVAVSKKKSNMDSDTDTGGNLSYS